MKSRKNNKLFSLRTRELSLGKDNNVKKKIDFESKSFRTKRIGSRVSNLSYTNAIFENKVDLNKEFIKKQYDTKNEIKEKLRKINSVRLKHNKKWHLPKNDDKQSPPTEVDLKKLKNLKKINKKKFSTSIGNQMFIPKFQKTGDSGGKFMSKSQSNFRKKFETHKNFCQPEMTLNLGVETTYPSPLKEKQKFVKLGFEITEDLNKVEVSRKRINKFLFDFFGNSEALTTEFNDSLGEISREVRNSLRILKPLEPKKVLSQLRIFVKNLDKIIEKIFQEKPVIHSVEKIPSIQEDSSPKNLNTNRTLHSRRSKSEIERSENVVEYSKLRTANNQIKEYLSNKEKIEEENKNLREKLIKSESKIRDMRTQFAANYQESDYNIHRMKLILTSLQEKVDDCYKTIEDLNTKLDWHKKEENSVSYRLKKHQETENRYKEIALMQVEEMNSIKKRERDLIEIIKELRNRIMIKKVEKSEIMTKETLDVFKAAEEDFKSQLENSLIDDYVYIKNSIVNDFEAFKNDQEEATKNYLRFSIENFVVQKAEMRQNLDEFDWQIRKIRNDFRLSNNRKGFLAQVDLSNLRLYKANLSNLLSYRVKNLSNQEVQEIIGQEFNLISLVRKIRAIFDCKWNEFTYYTDRRMYSKFSDFVYSWLGTFKLDLTSMKIVEAHNISNLFFNFSSTKRSRFRKIEGLITTQIVIIWQTLGMRCIQRFHR